MSGTGSAPLLVPFLRLRLVHKGFSDGWLFPVNVGWNLNGELLMAEEIVTRIKKLRANAIYGKKKHYNAADRKQKYQTWVGTAILSINILLGSALLVLLRSEVPDHIKWIGAGLSALAALLTAFQTYFGFQKAVNGHRQVAGRYLDFAHQCSNALAGQADGVLRDGQFAKRLDDLTKIVSKIDSDAHSYPTSDDDYEKAQAGMANGEESYTEQELGAGG